MSNYNPPDTPHVFTVNVRYHEDASALFAALGGTQRNDSVLLESADISTKSGISSLAVLEASVRITYDGGVVTPLALTASGTRVVDKLFADLEAYRNGDGLVFPASSAVDERERLVATSAVEPLRRLQNLPSYPQGSQLPLLAGGMAFDFLETFEDLPAVSPCANTYPDYQFVLAEIVLSINHQHRSAELIGIAYGEEEATRIQARLDELAEIISQDLAPPPSIPARGGTLKAHATVDDATFREQVSALKDNIYNGDIYQVVPARSFITQCEDAFVAYRRLRETNPSPYMFYVRGVADARAYELIGASPESNLKFDPKTRQVELYPIAGTRPRGLNPDGSVNHELDIRNELDMRTNAKELAEHTMLVDLARNDLARVGVAGTRRVADLLQVDRYSRVMHLVSRVVAELDPELDALDAYRACMNMGTLSGAPKLRAMELLRGVEKQRRGSYGGAVGYLRGGGAMDNCIVIRSAFIQDGQAIVQAGAGVVRDSDPQAEADETVAKAYAVLHALALAAGQELEVIR